MSDGAGFVSKELAEVEVSRMGVLCPTALEASDVSYISCTPECWLFDLPDVRVPTIEGHRSSFTLVVETVPSLMSCLSCGLVAVGHGRVAVRLHDLRCARVSFRVEWHKRRYRCPEDVCEVTTFRKFQELATSRAKLISPAIA